MMIMFWRFDIILWIIDDDDNNDDDDDDDDHFLEIWFEIIIWRIATQLFSGVSSSEKTRVSPSDICDQGYSIRYVWSNRYVIRYIWSVICQQVYVIRDLGSEMYICDQVYLISYVWSESCEQICLIRYAWSNIFDHLFDIRYISNRFDIFDQVYCDQKCVILL